MDAIVEVGAWRVGLIGSNERRREAMSILIGPCRFSPRLNYLRCLLGFVPSYGTPGVPL